MGRYFNDVVLATILHGLDTNLLTLHGITYMLPPEKIPAQPNPVTIRPIMKIAEDVADALIALPIPKTRNDDRKTIFIG
jgi:hypothetical protein